MALPTTGLVIPNVYATASDIDWTDTSAGAWKYALFNTSWSPDLTSALGYTTTNECSGTGYTAGGIALTSVTISRTGQLLMTCANITFTGVTVTDVACGALYYDDGTSPVTKPIVAIHRLASVGANNGGEFRIPLPSTPSTNTLIYVPGAA